VVPENHPAAEIVVRDLCFSYPPLATGAEAAPVLQGVNFDVRRGEFVALLGRVGAGKSTLCMALNGLVPQATGGTIGGDVTVAGLDTRRHRVSVLARTIGMVFQDPESQLVQMQVEDEIAFGLENIGLAAAEIDERIGWALDAVGLTGLRLRPPHSLSGGEKQRVAPAAVLAMQPRVLVLDEPTASLDPAGKAAVFDVLASLRDQRQITIFAATQEMERIAGYADRVLALHEGRIVMDGPPDEIFLRVDDLHDLGLGVPELAELGHLLARRTRGRYTFATPAAAYRDLQGQASRIGMDKLRPAPLHSLPPDRQFPSGDAAQVIIDHLSFTYPDGTHALHDVNLVLRKGEFVALLGPNGAGKSSLARHMNGLLKPTAGRVLLDGRDTRSSTVAALARAAGYVFQNPDHQIFAPTVREEVAFGLANQGMPAEGLAHRVDEALQAFHLTSQAETPPALLGYGQRRKVALASILAMQPHLLILDEPTGGLDWRSQRELMDRVTAFNALGRTVVLITHEMRLVAEFARRAVVLCEGRVLFEGSPRELFGRPEILARAQLAPPPVTHLAQRLADDGMDPQVLTTGEFAAAWLARLLAASRHKRAGRSAARLRMRRSVR
jgi:energy-coupling factor transporter ATP-binding protein EcfA2